MGKILETTLHGQKIGFHPQRVLLLPDLELTFVLASILHMDVLRPELELKFLLLSMLQRDLLRPELQLKVILL